MPKKVLLFINGEAPQELPSEDDFQLIGCTDGAFHYLKQKNFSIDKLDFISGDFDSHTKGDETVYSEKFIHTPDQNKTDFHKALEIIIERDGEEVWVFGASGKEQDHFLGNLHTAYLFKDTLKILFFDEYSSYFFIPNKIILNDVLGKTISLIPFPLAEDIYTTGLYWELNGEMLSLTKRIGTRNKAKDNRVEIKYTSGAMLLFVER